MKLIFLVIMFLVIFMSNCASIEKKTYLKDLLSAYAQDTPSNTNNLFVQETVQKCQLRPIEISLMLKNCGRVLFEATQCIGICESKELYIPYKQLLKTTSSSCKADGFEKVKRLIECEDRSKRIINIKIISNCSCQSQTNIFKNN